MTLIKNYNYSENEITSFIVDTYANYYLWIAFAKEDENCLLKKVSANNPLQTYFNINITVDEITKMFIDNTYLYLAYDDDSLIGARYSLTNPNSSYTNFDLPVGITESPVDVLVSGSNLFYLIPGNDSGTNTKIVKMTLTGSFVETIDLSTVSNASSFTVDSGGDIWIVTNTSPATYIRVYQNSGGTYVYTSYTYSSTEYAQNVVYDTDLDSLFYITDTAPAKIAKIAVNLPASPTESSATITSCNNAKDIVLNDSNDYLYSICAGGKVSKIDKSNISSQSIISTGESDDFVNIDALDSFFKTFCSTDDSDGEIVMIDESEIEQLNTDLRWLQEISTILHTQINTTLGEKISTDLRFNKDVDTTVSTDLRWLEYDYDELSQHPIDYSDIQVQIDGTDLCPLNDVNLKSIQIRHVIEDEEEKGSQAIFTLNRRHDKLDYDNQGNFSQISNQNSVKIYIYGNLEFDGKVSNISAESESENVIISALGIRPSISKQTIGISLPSINENIHLYQCLVNNVDIDNPYIDPNSENPTYYNGIKIQLGTQITQNNLRYRNLGSVTGLAEKIENGTFIPLQTWTYFWFGYAVNFITGVNWTSARYLGTSLGSLEGDTWNIKGISYYYQKRKDDDIEELGEYTVGSAPFNEVSVQNGKLVTKDRWEDRSDGLYRVKDESYDYTQYAQDIANLEYQKLLNINGQILPNTSATISLSLDAYYFYNIKLLTRINILNTTTSNIYNNNNGFPVAAKTIVIDTSSMTVNISCDNQLSIVELKEIDDLYPDENSDEYIIEAEAVKVNSKFDPNTWSNTV